MTRRATRSTMGVVAALTVFSVGCVSHAAPEEPATPAPSITQPSTAKDQTTQPVDPHCITVNLVWRDREQDVLRTVDERVITDDADLEATLRAAKAGHMTDDRPAYVLVDAHDQVPWKDIVTVINTCSRVGIKKLEFGFGKGQ